MYLSLRTCTALTKSRTEATTRTAHCHLHSSGQRNGAKRRTKISFGRTMIQLPELLQFAKRDEMMMISAKIKPITLAVIKVCMSEGNGK